MNTRVRVRAPGTGERLLAVLTIGLLAFGLPSVWLTPDNTGVSTGDTSTIAVFTLLFAIAVTRLVGSWHHVTRAIRREPFLLAFILFLVASTAWSTSPDVTFRRTVALLLTTFFGYYLVVRFPLQEIIRLSAIAMMAGTALNIVWIFGLRKYGVTQVTTDLAESGDWSGIYVHKNALGRGALLSAMIFVFAARSLPRWRPVYWVFVVINLLLIVGAHSKTALVAFVLLMVLMGLFTGLRAHATLYGGVAFGLIGTSLLGIGFVTTNLGPITQSLGRDATLTGRTQLWTDVIHEISKHPLFGFGWSGFWTGAPDGPSGYVLQRNLWHPPDAHNAILELAVNVGIIGTVLFCVTYFRALYRSVGHVRRVPTVLGLFPLAYLSYVLLESVTEAGIVDRDISWTLFVVAVVLAARDRSEGRAPSAPTIGETLPSTHQASAASPLTARGSDQEPTKAKRPSFTVQGPPT